MKNGAQLLLDETMESVYERRRHFNRLAEETFTQAHSDGFLHFLRSVSVFFLSHFASTFAP